MRRMWIKSCLYVLHAFTLFVLCFKARIQLSFSEYNKYIHTTISPKRYNINQYFLLHQMKVYTKFTFLSNVPKLRYIPTLFRCKKTITVQY